MIENNPPEPIKLNWDPNLDIVLDFINPEQFYKHYQELASTREKQKQNLKYPRKNAIKLKSHSCTCIDLKVALEILATTIVQLASKNSLAKKKINIRREIIDAGYVGNIIVMLQNNLEKTYVIKPNEKITQTIFLPLVKIAQLVLVKNREELGITVRKISGFEFIGRIDIPINMAKKEIVDKGEIISTSQSVFILLYNRHMLIWKRKVKNQAQIFETELTICKSKKIGLTNFYIPAKNKNYIKIPIYNTTENVIEIPKKTTIEYLSTEVKEQLPNTISDFPQLCRYVDIILQTIYK
ncbi:hypothetical protein G9A89_013639 [Geosiphon pyriformis]|nr:hypothetical protein G9A89_013639 [Geosiphon pyriformis]